MEFKTEGFPKHVKKLEVPRIEELLLMPYFNNVLAEDVYKHGTEFQKYLLDNSNLTHKKKHVGIFSVVNFLTPNNSPVVNIHAKDKEWHVDAGSSFLRNPSYETSDYFHLLISGNELTSITEFNDTPFSIDLNQQDMNNICKILNEYSYFKETLNPQKAEINTMIDFNSTNIHRALRPTQPEFRFIWRAIETDEDYNLLRFEDSFKNSYIYDGSQTSIENIIKDGKDIIIKGR